LRWFKKSFVFLGFRDHSDRPVALSDQDPIGSNAFTPFRVLETSFESQEGIVWNHRRTAKALVSVTDDDTIMPIQA
jgi:hypothetical protein